MDVEIIVHPLDICPRIEAPQLSGSSLFAQTPPVGDELPADVWDQTDIFLYVVPSVVPGDGSGYDEGFITGGMYPGGPAPIFVSGDAWFLRKQVSQGAGPYTDLEARVYFPYWFEHEFMHHVFASWSEFGLEQSLHQWANLSSWPNDFEGLGEPDYFYEAITKRLVDAVPSPAARLSDGDRSSFGELDAGAFVGEYAQDWPSEATLTISQDTEGLLWTSTAPTVTCRLHLFSTRLAAGINTYPNYINRTIVVQADELGVATLQLADMRFERPDLVEGEPPPPDGPDPYLVSLTGLYQTPNEPRGSFDAARIEVSEDNELVWVIIAVGWEIPMDVAEDGSVTLGNAILYSGPVTFDRDLDDDVVGLTVNGTYFEKVE